MHSGKLRCFEIGCLETQPGLKKNLKYDLCIPTTSISPFLLSLSQHTVSCGKAFPLCPVWMWCRGASVQTLKPAPQPVVSGCQLSAHNTIMSTWDKRAKSPRCWDLGMEVSPCHLSFLLLSLQHFLQLLPLLLGERFPFGNGSHWGLFLFWFAGREDQGVALIDTLKSGHIYGTNCY